MRNKRVKVLFVGSFIDKAKDGSVGGQMFACKSLVNSSLKESIDWILLDTTGESVPPPPVRVRLGNAIVRIFKFFFLLITKRPKYSLIFSANGTSIYEKGLMVVLSACLGVKAVFAPRGGPIVDEIKRSAFKKYYVKMILKFSYKVICQGKFWKQYYMELSPKSSVEKFEIVFNWIDVSKYPYQEIKSSNPNSVSILFMGWIQEDKGVFELFEALRLLKHSGNSIHVNMLGDGPAKAQLVNMSKTFDSNFYFDFPGWVHGEVKNSYLKDSDIFILPSHGEGMPNSLMEAMASGVAGIATNVGAVPDLIEQNITGIMIDVKEPIQIKNALEDLIENVGKRQVISVQARNRIINNHSLESAEKRFQIILTK